MNSRLFALFALCAVTFSARAAFVDYGLTLGTFINNESVVSSGSGLFELGVFSGYNDTLGTSFFTGKDYATLRGSWSPFAGSSTAIDSSGGFYVRAVDLLSTAVNTRLFAWGFSTVTASASANWSIISGEIGGTNIYAPVWLAVAPTDITVNVIEVGTANNVIYAESNPANSLQTNSVAPSDLSANVIVSGSPPDPSSSGGSFTARAPGGVRFLTGLNENVGVVLTNGAASWASLSDRNAKAEPSPVDNREVLRKVAQMPVTSWEYKHDPGRHYIGPMAQDFHAAFGLGHDDKHISTLDTDGVALSALQGLIAELQERKDRSAAQATRLRELEAELQSLRERLASK